MYGQLEKARGLPVEQYRREGGVSGRRCPWGVREVRCHLVEEGVTIEVEDSCSEGLCATVTANDIFWL